MSFGDHTDLIRQVQLSLREEAGLSYNPNDPNLPPIPPLRESIAALDPSSPDLRCKHCQGRLLRGLQSVICVYCGRRQQRDVNPDPIAFKSTLGYQWLLQSLGLDGSETVGPAIEEHEQRRGQSTTGGEILLSDLLNFQIAWPTELEKTEVDVTRNVAVQDLNSFDLPEEDDDELDKFLAESRREFVSNAPEEQPRSEDQSLNVETKAFPSQENINLFQNAQQSVAVSSSGVEDNDGFSGWEADFQAADSGNQQETSTSFVGPSVDLSFHMDSVFGPVKDLQAEKATEASSTPLESATASWMQDDLWDSNLLAPPPAKRVDATILRKDDDWFTNDQFQTSSGTASENKAAKENDDSFDVWNDCVTAPENMGTKENDDSFDVWNDCVTAPENKTIDEEDDSFDDWNDFTSSTRAQDLSKNSLAQSGNHVAGADVQISENMFSSSIDNFEDIDFGSFSQAEVASTSSNQNDSVEVNSLQKDDHASPWMASVEADEAGLHAGEAAEMDDLFNSKVSSEQQHDIESLLSQMHDLSFMLKSDLSVPAKQGYSDPSLF